MFLYFMILQIIHLNSFQVKDEHKSLLEQFFKQCLYVKGSYDKKSDFQNLGKELEKLGGGKSINQVFYLALPPSVFKDATTNIKNCCMTKRYCMVKKLNK